jgi:hypothetical protein
MSSNNSSTSIVDDCDDSGLWLSFSVCRAQQVLPRQMFSPKARFIDGSL